MPRTTLLLSALALAATACASSTTPSDAGPTPDARATDAGGGGGPCPASEPPSGVPCTRPGLVCAYGDDPRPECRPRVTCTSGAWLHDTPTPGCDPLPPATCPATREAAQGNLCTPEGAMCSYDGLACACTRCPDPYPLCRELPAPVWACDAPNPDAECPAAIPNLGMACAPEGKLCSYGCERGMDRQCTGGVWVEQSSPGGCPISRRRAKRDIAYLSPAELDRLAHDVSRLPLATFEYVDPALAGRRHLGFIIEDAPESFAVDPERSQVDLYGYTSLVLAAAQAQARRIDALEREVRALRRARRGRGAR